MRAMHFCPAARVALSLSCSFALLVVLPGCKREDKRGKDFTPPNPNAPTRYGPITNARPAQAPLAKIAEPFPSAAWTSTPLAVLQTELSPATLIHSTSRHLSLFAGLTNAGLGAPSHVAWSKPEGPRSFKQGEKLEIAQMQEGWVLVWWAGAAGWTNFWDSPWVVFLQHQPKSLRLDADGLHFVFPAQAGDVVLMPLYGYEKAPQAGKDERATHGLSPRKVPLRTWDWAQGLTRDPLTRIRYWASVTRELPIRCEESSSVDRANDSVTIRSHFERHSIRDDWNTPSLKLAPISPTLMLAVKSGTFPVHFSRSYFDLDMPTPYGPLAAIVGVDEFDVTLPVLQYVNETEAVSQPGTNAHPNVALSLERLRVEGMKAFTSTNRSADICQTLQDSMAWSKALPYLDHATRSNGLAWLGRYFREEVLVKSRFVGRVADGGTNEVPDSNPALLEALWTYAHFSGDWTLVREHWPLVRGLLLMRQEMGWPSFGATVSPAIGDQTSHVAAFARLAWQAGDLTAYQEACGAFARAVTQVSVQQRGAAYFRQLQPWHTMEFMDEEIFVTHLDHAAGWQLGGPKFPAQAKERPFNQRWMRFRDVDVARFLRDYFSEDLRREMNWLDRRWPKEPNQQSSPSALPSISELRALLLHESPAELVRAATTDSFTASDPDVVTSCLATIRAASPLRYERLIPPGPPTPFLPDEARNGSKLSPSLITSVKWEGTNSAEPQRWPELAWPAWQAQNGARWSFGEIRATRSGLPQKARELPLNANTRGILFE